VKTSKHSKTGKQRNTEFFYQNKETPKNKKHQNKETPKFLYQVVELSTSDCSIFTENEGLAQIKFIITIHDFGPDYTLH